MRRWTPIVHRFATRLLADEHGARDATQETMIKVLRHLDRYDDTRSFKTWVLSIARNTCIDAHRKSRRYAWEEPGEIASAAPSPLQEVTRAEQARAVRDALAGLPAMYREILVLYHFEHLKYAEIAEALDLPLGTVMNRIFRARRKLRDALGEAP